MTFNLSQYDRVRDARMSHGKPFVVGHRGSPAHAPENTLHAFQLAVEQGAQMVETDLWITRDRQLVLLHDRSLERTTGRPGLVQEMELSELVEIPTLDLAGQESPHPIPSLSALLDFAQASGTALLLELKDPRFSLAEYGRLLVEALTEHQMLQSSLIVSFAPQCLLALRRLCPTLPVGLVGHRMPVPDPRWDLVGPAYPNLFLNPLFIRMARRRRALVAPLDPHPERRLAYYLRMGVDAILADDVAQIAALLDQTPPGTNQMG